jgi:hypothetical protein
MYEAPDKRTESYGVVQHFNNSLPHALPDLFTALFQYKRFPQEWKHANCIIIQKQGREKKGDPKGYRPISLLSCMGKIFERIVEKRITTAGVQCGAIANNQMGGQAQNSAIDALLKTLDRIARDLGKRLLRRTQLCSRLWPKKKEEKEEGKQKCIITGTKSFRIFSSI